MKCPECEAWTNVLETRTLLINIKRRRYQCANLHKFNTYEIGPDNNGLFSTISLAVKSIVTNTRKKPNDNS